jgi:hypothetical protein
VDDLIREAAAAPIVEEPSTTPTLEMEQEHQKKQKKTRKGLINNTKNVNFNSTPTP